MEYPFPPPAEVPFSARAAITSLYVIALLEMAALLAYACRWLRPQWRHAAVWALSAVVIIVSAPALATDPRPMPDAVPWPLVTAVVPLALLGLVVATVQLSSLNPVLPYEAAILALVSVIFLVPPVKTVHRAARRAQCRNNLKQIGLGMHQFHDRHGVLPPAVSGNPAVSWRVNLLPHTDYSELHRRYDPHGSWDTPSNLSLANETVSLYRCPSAFRGETERKLDCKFTSYAMLVGPKTLGGSPDGTRIQEISDGLSNSLAVIEACGRDIVWTEPRDVDVQEMPPRINAPGRKLGDSHGWASSWHPGGAHALIADGTVKFVNQNIDPDLLHRLATIDGGEKVGDF